VTFDWSDWGKGSLRLGHVTLLPDAFDWEKLSLTTHNGGKDCETFSLKDSLVDHGAPVSFLVSSSHGLGLTEGWAEIGDGKTTIRIDVDRATAPLLGFLTHQADRRQPVLPARAFGTRTRRDPQAFGLSHRCPAFSIWHLPRAIRRE
jgi:hypothetical protein